MLETTACPDPQCQVPAEVIERFELPSTSGPLEHMSTRCVLRHVFTVPTDRIYTFEPFRLSALPQLRGLVPPI